ncbi:MAG: cell wall metabolism sensor histidine kinase WalK [Acidobacteria bacterium]|nr:cell wall metabolism sensor histidine kinase WalK [Acidobacteriota bacterium]
MKNTLFLKIFVGHVLLIVLSIGILFLVTINLFRNFYYDSLTTQMQNIGYGLKLDIYPYLEKKNFNELDAYLKEYGKAIQTRITVVDKNGRVLADSDEDTARMEDHRFRPEIMRAFAGEIGSSRRFSRTIKTGMFYIGLPIERGGEVTEVLRLSLYVDQINSLLAVLRKNITTIITGVLLLALILAFLLSRNMTKPVTELRNASQQIAKGDFDTKVFIRNKGELRTLGISFNSMTERIKDLFSQLSRNKEELNSILGSMEEGLIAIDKDGKIRVFNDSIMNFLGQEELAGKYYWEVIREASFNRLIKKCQESKTATKEEIALNDRFFLCSANDISRQNEIVVTFHDITEVKIVEKIKRDFVVNVSHELRTPLTSIKGFVETLEERAVDDDQRNYLSIIKRNTDRLVNIVQDLLLLSELEDQNKTHEMEEIDLVFLLRNVEKLILPELEKKGLKFSINIKGDLPKIEADAFQLEQVFINLLDNAVKYTDEGKIDIDVKESGGCVEVRISDTGVGITEEDLPRIFERFYVTDKARSRRQGGTGLGLSIVKHILLLHDGDIAVTSTEGKGTTVTVSLPVNHP